MSRDLTQLTKQLNNHLKTSVKLEGAVNDTGTFTGIAISGKENDIEDFFQTLHHLGIETPQGDEVMLNSDDPENLFQYSGEFSFNVEKVLSASMPSFVRCRNCHDRIFIPEDFEGDRVYCHCGSGEELAK